MINLTYATKTIYRDLWQLQDRGLEETCAHGSNSRRRTLGLETTQLLQSTLRLGVREPSHQGQEPLLAIYHSISHRPAWPQCEPEFKSMSAGTRSGAAFPRY